MDIEKYYKKFKKSKSQLNQFCSKHKINQSTFQRKAKALYPDEWSELIASRKPKSSSYALGRSFEYSVRNLLRKHGYFVVRSAQSKGEADLVALALGSTLLVQCKRGGSISKEERTTLYRLAQRLGAEAIIADRRTGRGVNLERLCYEGTESYILLDFTCLDPINVP